MKNAKEIAIHEKNEWMQKNEKTLEALHELRGPVSTYDKNIIDKRFNEKFFTEKNEYREWTRFNYTAPRYSFSQHKYEISVGGEVLCLQTRARNELLDAVDAKIESVQLLQEQLSVQIERLEALDIDAVVAALRAVFYEHGEPSIWTQILDEYAVKYPKN